MDVLSPEQRKKNMKAIKSKYTKIEEILGKTLWHMGYRYRRNNKDLTGNPDFAFRKEKIAIFCDSEFFHGKNWETQKHRIKTNRDFWHKKIEGKIRRDEKVNKLLTDNGWKVLRFWEKKKKKNLELCLKQIEEAIEERRNG